ncbi:MAG TPA: sulfatase-like hydrolase/transferase [Thermomicrobiales bacterium]|jgi:choline-sulfatase|nr:sulfatase-like hydrolase/transferase [Thermomicrobiales bacterium]
MPSDRPNILLICTDQQRYDALGCYGNDAIETPTIDGLASDGMRFERCYVQSPVCAPSRASLLTGQYVQNHGLWANGVPLPDQARLFTRDLADAGYDCGLIGKMHLAAAFEGRTEPRYDDGFRVYRWSHDPSHGSPDNAYHHWLEREHPDLYRRAVAARTGEGDGSVTFDDMPTEAHSTRWTAEEAIAFLGEGRDPAKPFFLQVNFYDPHHPFVAPPDYLDRYDPATLLRPLVDAMGPDTKPSIQREASRESYAGHAPGFAAYTSDEIQEIVRAYYAMVTFIDDEVRRILDRLDALGLRDDTVVIFTSDHGEMLGDHGLLLKGPFMYEGAVRVPLIIRWPGRLPSGERRSELVQWIDLAPTILRLAGINPPRTFQGDDLLPLARGDDDARDRGWAICQYLNSGHPYDPPVLVTMLRTDRYKLIVLHGPPATDRPREGELYDLDADPDELVNLWDEPESAPIRVELERRLIDILVATTDRSQPREAPW